MQRRSAASHRTDGTRSVGHFRIGRVGRQQREAAVAEVDRSRSGRGISLEILSQLFGTLVVLQLHRTLLMRLLLVVRLLDGSGRLSSRDGRCGSSPSVRIGRMIVVDDLGGCDG